MSKTKKNDYFWGLPDPQIPEPFGDMKEHVLMDHLCLKELTSLSPTYQWKSFNKFASLLHFY